MPTALRAGMGACIAAINCRPVSFGPTLLVAAMVDVPLGTAEWVQALARTTLLLYRLTATLEACILQRPLPV